MTFAAERYCVRVAGRGVVTEFNGVAIFNHATAELVVRSIELLHGDRCTIEKLVVAVPVSSSELRRREEKFAAPEPWDGSGQ